MFSGLEDNLLRVMEIVAYRTRQLTEANVMLAFDTFISQNVDNIQMSLSNLQEACLNRLIICAEEESRCDTGVLRSFTSVVQTRTNVSEAIQDSFVYVSDTLVAEMGNCVKTAFDDLNYSSKAEHSLEDLKSRVEYSLGGMYFCIMNTSRDKFTFIYNVFVQTADWLTKLTEKVRKGSNIRDLKEQSFLELSTDASLEPSWLTNWRKNGPQPTDVEIRADTVEGDIHPPKSGSELFAKLEEEISILNTRPRTGDEAYSSKDPNGFYTKKGISALTGEWGEQFALHAIKEHFGERIRTCYILNASEGKGTHFDIVLELDIGLFIVEVKSTKSGYFKSSQHLSEAQKYYASMYKDHFILASVRNCFTNSAQIRFIQNPIERESSSDESLSFSFDCL